AYDFASSPVVHSRSPSRLPPDASPDAFSATLTTTAHSPQQLAVVWDLPLQSGPGGPTSITGTAPHPAITTFYIATSIRVRGAPSSAYLSNGTVGTLPTIHASKASCRNRFDSTGETAEPCGGAPARG